MAYLLNELQGLSLMQFCAFLIYTYLFFYVLTRNFKAVLNRFIAIFFAVMSVWALNEVIVKNIYVQKSTAIISNNVASIGWVGFSISILWITLIFTEKIKKENIWKFYFLSLIPYFVFIFVQITQGKIIEDLKLVSWGWQTVWSDSVWFYGFTMYYTFCVLAAIFILFGFIKATKNIIKKKQGIILLYCTIIPFVVGLINDAILPKIGIDFLPDMSVFMGLIWAFAMVYSMAKYKFLTLTPETAAEDIISTMTDSLVLVGPDANILVANQYTLDLLGYKESELIEKPVTYIFGKRKDKNPFHGSDLRQLLDKESIRDYEMSYLMKTGEEIPMNFSGSTRRDNDGNLVGVVCIARDMRQMKKLIEKEKELAVESAQAEAERDKAQELEKAYTKLKDMQSMLVQSEKLRAIGQLGAGVAHELNNPLAGILCLMRSYMNKTDPKSDEYEDLKEMEEGCEFMAKVIRGLSDFTRKSDEIFMEVNCNNVIESIVSLVGPQFERKQLKLEIEYAEEKLMVRGERQQLQQVVVNMVNNAREVLSHGGILRITTRKIEEDGKMYAEMEFSDNGCGMSEEVKTQIFDHFFTTKQVGGGVGLGLSIVHSIITEHDGKIEVESEEGKGATFKIRIPLV